MQTISVASIKSGGRLDVDILVSGNFDAGTKEAGDKLFQDFKNSLLEKVKAR